MSKISIITPNYNYAHFIGKTIESIIDQGYENWEHIIVDDGSTDNSVEIIESYANKYPVNIKLIKQANSGQTKALNVALSNVTGDIIAWINSDDFYCKAVFTQIINVFKNNPDVDAVFGNIDIINGKGNLVKTNKYLPFNYASGVFNDFGKIVSSNAIFWRRELTDRVGAMNEDYEFAMDSEFWSRLLYKANVKRIPLTIATFRRHDETKTVKSWDMNSRSYKKRVEETRVIKTRAYNNLYISKIIPLSVSLPIHYYYRIKRQIKKFIYFSVLKYE